MSDELERYHVWGAIGLMASMMVVIAFYRGVSADLSVAFIWAMVIGMLLLDMWFEFS